MTADHSTPTPPASNPVPAKPPRPEKPSPDFPLYAHGSGYWAKRIHGRMCYFGKWSKVSAEDALKKYLEQREDLHAGRKPDASKAVNVKDLCNSFLNAKAAKRDAGELASRSWSDYEAACKLVVKHLGKTALVSSLDPDDFARLRQKMVAKGWGPATIGNTIQRCRVVFKFAYDNGLIDRPVRYGQGFDRPSLKTMRKHRAKLGPKLFTADEIRRLIGAAGVPMKAILLLGINCGYGNSDCGNLPLSAVDLDNAFIDFPRPKTGIPRRCPLWPETVAAIREAFARRHEAKDPENAGLVFVTKYGGAWAKDVPDSPVTKETKKLLLALGINGRKGLGFYTMRHTFRTVADEAKDQPAADYIMGHQSTHMSSTYRERISDARLRAVVDHVRTWLFPTPAPVDGEELATLPMKTA
jgi:integrase